MSHVLVIDNYDSFTYNLVQAFLTTGVEVTVEYNDDISVEQAVELGPSHLVVSPGPGRPEDAGVSVEMIATSPGGSLCSESVSVTRRSGWLSERKSTRRCRCTAG